MSAVGQMEAKGYTVRFEHYRPDGWDVRACPACGRLEEPISHRYYRGNSDWRPFPRGGFTLCLVYQGTDEFPVAVGRANCSWKDNFNYRLGREIAAGRALVALDGAE